MLNFQVQLFPEYITRSCSSLFKRLSGLIMVVKQPLNHPRQKLGARCMMSTFPTLNSGCSSPFSRWRVVGGFRTPAWGSVCLNTEQRPVGRRASGWSLHQSRCSTPAPNTPGTGASYTACRGKNPQDRESRFNSDWNRKCFVASSYTLTRWESARRDAAGRPYTPPLTAPPGKGSNV